MIYCISKDTYNSSRIYGVELTVIIYLTPYLLPHKEIVLCLKQKP